MSEICVGPASIEPGSGQSFIVGEKCVAVMRGKDGVLYAISSVCPHAGGGLAQGAQGNGTVICPDHGWKFELKSGRCLNNPDYRVRTYKVREEAGSLYVTLP